MVKIFVGNCPETSTGDDLHHFFSRYGKVSQADVLHTKRYGFVHMDSQDEAEAAVRALDGSDLKGSKIRVELSIPKRDGGGPMRGGGSRGRGGGGSFGSRRGGGYRDSFGRGRERNGRGGSSYSPRSGGGGRGRPGFSPRRRDDDYDSRGGGDRYIDDGGRGRRFNDAPSYGGGAGYNNRESSRRYDDTPYARNSGDAYSQRYRQASPIPRGDPYSRSSYDRAPSPQMAAYRGSFGSASAYDGRRSPLPPAAVDYERRAPAAAVASPFLDQRREMTTAAMGMSAADLGYERRQPAPAAVDPFGGAASYYQQTRNRSPSPSVMAAARQYPGVNASDIRQQPARYYADPYADPFATRSYPNALSRSPPRGQPVPRQMM